MCTISIIYLTSIAKHKKNLSPLTTLPPKILPHRTPLIPKLTKLHHHGKLLTTLHTILPLAIHSQRNNMVASMEGNREFPNGIPSIVLLGEELLAAVGAGGVIYAPFEEAGGV